MKKIRDIIRLSQNPDLSRRQIAKILGVSRPVIDKYLSDLKTSGLAYSQVEAMSDSELLSQFEKKEEDQDIRYKTLMERFPRYVKELKRTGVTLRLLWEEYRKDHPEGYQYSQFCYHFQIWSDALDVTMHMDHKAGDRMYVDFAGDKLAVINSRTGEEMSVEVFVAILAASGMTYVEASLSTKSEEWIRSNERAMRYFGGVTRAIVPDNLKQGVSQSHRYEPGINPLYDDFAQYYGTIILPARARHPKDKAMVENAVRLVYQRIYAPIRDRIFFSLEELNQTIRDLLELHNQAPFQRLKISRKDLFEEIEKNVLKPLPMERYGLKTFRELKVQYNYHVELREDRHFYSVPWYLKGKQVRVIYDERVVTIYYDNVRIAQHLRDRAINGYTTLPDHMPGHHRFYKEWSPDRFLRWARSLGDPVVGVIQGVLDSRDHPEQAFRTCMGILNLGKKYGPVKLTRACEIANRFKLYSYKRIVSILEKGLADQTELEFQETPIPVHENIRGIDYYR